MSSVYPRSPLAYYRSNTNFRVRKIPRLVGDGGQVVELLDVLGHKQRTPRVPLNPRGRAPGQC